jgi:hypothetical protein
MTAPTRAQVAEPLARSGSSRTRPHTHYIIMVVDVVAVVIVVVADCIAGPSQPQADCIARPSRPQGHVHYRPTRSHRIGQAYSATPNRAYVMYRGWSPPAGDPCTTSPPRMNRTSPALAGILVHGRPPPGAWPNLRGTIGRTLCPPRSVPTNVSNCCTDVEHCESAFAPRLHFPDVLRWDP